MNDVNAFQYLRAISCKRERRGKKVDEERSAAKIKNKKDWRKSVVIVAMRRRLNSIFGKIRRRLKI